MAFKPISFLLFILFISLLFVGQFATVIVARPGTPPPPPGCRSRKLAPWMNRKRDEPKVGTEMHRQRDDPNGEGSCRP